MSNESTSVKTGFRKGLSSEWRKIRWPDKASVGRQTAVVLGTTAALGVAISVIDFGAQQLLRLIMMIGG